MRCLKQRRSKTIIEPVSRPKDVQIQIERDITPPQISPKITIFHISQLATATHTFQDFSQPIYQIKRSYLRQKFPNRTIKNEQIFPLTGAKVDHKRSAGLSGLYVHKGDRRCFGLTKLRCHLPIEGASFSINLWRVRTFPRPLSSRTSEIAHCAPDVLSQPWITSFSERRHRNGERRNWELIEATVFTQKNQIWHWTS